VTKSRESFLPEIADAFIDQYKHKQNIHTIKLTTASPVSEELKQQIIGNVKQQTALQNVELNAEVNEALIGGFVLEIDGTLIDASVAYDLAKIKSQFQNNDFIYKIR